jgi:TetR/AcrR family transcriptional regulator, acrAB operon repressor
MPRRTAEHAARTREAILDAGLAVFAKSGFAAAQLEEIAARAKVTRGALYHHFTGKAELYGAVMKERWNASMDPITALLEGEGAPADRLRDFIGAFAAALESDRRVRTLLEMSLSGDSLLPELRSGRSDKARALDAWVASVAKVLVEAGVARREADLRARALVAYLNGVAVSWILGSPAIEPTRDAATLAGAILDGVLGRRTRGRSGP